MNRKAPTTSGLADAGMAPVPQAAWRVVLTVKLDGIAAAPVALPEGDGVGVGVGLGVGDGVGVGVGVGVGDSSGTVTGPDCSDLTSVLQLGSKVSRSDDASAARKRII